jgi:hypothetical protein
VAVGIGGIMTSLNRENWIKTYTPSFSYAINGITYGNEKFVAVDLIGKVYLSNNALVWSSYTISPEYQYQSYELQSVVCDGG